MAEFVNLGKRYDFDCVYFSQLANYGTFSEKEFATRAIHCRQHPRHSEFVNLLKSEIFLDPIVDLGNLSMVRGLSY